MHNITSTKSWGALEKLHAEKSRTTLRDLFQADAQRAQRYTFDAAGLRAVSYTHLTLPTILRV